MTRAVQRQDLIYPELCYEIIGVLFDVWTQIGAGHKEKVYQKAVSRGLEGAGLKSKEQLPARIQYEERLVGTYYFDFLVNHRVILEIKARNYFSVNDIRQLYSYLKASGLKLGIIAHFTRSGVKFKRVVNLA